MGVSQPKDNALAAKREASEQSESMGLMENGQPRGAHTYWAICQGTRSDAQTFVLQFLATPDEVSFTRDFTRLI